MNDLHTEARIAAAMDEDPSGRAYRRGFEDGLVRGRTDRPIFWRVITAIWIIGLLAFAAGRASATSEAPGVGEPVEARAEASRVAAVPAAGVGASSPATEAHPSPAMLGTEP